MEKVAEVRSGRLDNALRGLKKEEKVEVVRKVRNLKNE